VPTGPRRLLRSPTATQLPTGHRDALAVEFQPDLVRAVDLVVLLLHPGDLGPELVIAYARAEGGRDFAA